MAKDMSVITSNANASNQEEVFIARHSLFTGHYDERGRVISR